MGNDNQYNWESGKKRKVLILSFEQSYTEQALRIFTKKGSLEKLKKLNFYIEDRNFENLILSFWVLSPENRHFWKHHFLGAQGIILIFAFENKRVDPNIKNEVLNIINDVLLYDSPILILYDKNNKIMQEEMNLELRHVNQIEDKDFEKVWIENLDFKGTLVEVQPGLKWLCKQMKLASAI